MSFYFGIDTSNYTTSAAAFDDVSGCVFQKKFPLPVKSGERGLRQSDAVFHHTAQLHMAVREVMENCKNVAAFGASRSPRDVDGSYMPCFLVGLNTAECMAAASGKPIHSFSHQAGHIAAAAYSSGHSELLDSCFLAFHVSGGTTEALVVEPDSENILKINTAAATLDLNAGQAVDRVGVALGLDFPAGAALEKLALQSERRYKAKPFLREGNCSLSGVENRCLDMIKSGESPCDTARFCLDSIAAALEGMTEHLLREYGELPLIYAGGVMSNSIIRARFEKKYGAFFAKPEFSCDNAAGTAYLTYLKEVRNA